jgi:NTP pyrophosphatase (non-canonical NTP hydrolase)
MNFSEYQSEARKTAIYPDEFKVTYPALGLAGEAGEIANKVKKILRDDGGHVTEKRRESLAGEISDCLWYIAALATDLGLNLDDIAKHNIEKLHSRQIRGVLGGDGDTR